MPDEQYAVVVVCLMQEATRGETAGVALESFPMNVVCSQHSAVWSFKGRMDLAN